MRVVSWNMGCATKRYCRYRDEAWRLLLDLGPDVVLVQEAMLDVPPWLRDHGTLFLHAAYAGQSWGSGVLACGGSAKAQTIELSGSFVAAADVDWQGTSVLVASLHVCPGPKLARNVAALGAALPRHLAGRAFVVGGDLNSSRHFDAVYKRKTHASFVAQMVACGAHDCLFALHGKESQSYWGRSREAYQLDHIYVDAGTAQRVRACEVPTTDETRKLSDHSPLVLDLV